MFLSSLSFGAALFASVSAGEPAATARGAPPDASPIPTVAAVLETPPVGMAGDAADDPAIVLGAQPGDTRIIGTQKKGGLYVYDLTGALVQFVPGGRPNNVDQRPGFPFKSGTAPIVVTSDRSDNTLVLYRFDPRSLSLDAAPAARIPTGWPEVYGVAIGKSGDAFVLAATSKAGEVKQWTLQHGAEGAIGATQTRAFALGSIAEGMVIDDANGALYISQELVGLWRFPLDPSRGDAGRLVDQTTPKGRLQADVEGVTLWNRADGTGFLFVSAQGASLFHVYERQGANRYRGAFRIGPSRAADGVSHTDGIDVTSVAFGESFPAGLFVAQDDENTGPAAAQNFKYVSVADIIAALQLEP